MAPPPAPPPPPATEHVAAVVARLAAAGCLAPDEEAHELLAAVGGRAGPLEDALRRREEGEPLAWITGRTTFCGHEVLVDPGVYVPRPQTEALARRAAALLAGHGRATGRPGEATGRLGEGSAMAVDLCTGSGAVAKHCLRAAPGAGVVGVDADPLAVACARRNGVPAMVGDLGASLRAGFAQLVTAVAPYVPIGDMAFLPSDVVRHEPRAALVGGPDGLDVVRRVVAEAARLLRAGGWLLIEIGGRQDALLAPDLAAHGFGDVVTWEDEDGDLRGAAARLGRAG